MTTTQDLRPDAVIEYSRGSIDFITATVADRNGNNLDMDVDLAITADDPTVDDAHVWLAADWAGTVGPERTVTTTAPVNLSAPTYAGGRYGVYIRLDNAPAHPIFRIGTLVITD